MSEADKMFEELGYKKWIDSRNITHFIHKKKEKDFTFMNGNCYSIKRPTKKEQIAINKKVEELRMDMSNKTSDKNVGSIEEDIRILENLKSYLNLLVYEGKDKIIYNDLLWDEKTVDCINAIEHLINNYTRQKQINEEHQKINGELREKVKELEEERQIVGMPVRNKRDGKIGIVLHQWENGSIAVLENISPRVINTHDSFDTLEIITDEVKHVKTKDDSIPVQKVKDKIEKHKFAKKYFEKEYDNKHYEDDGIRARDFYGIVTQDRIIQVLEELLEDK